MAQGGPASAASVAVAASGGSGPAPRSPRSVAAGASADSWLPASPRLGADDGYDGDNAGSSASEPGSPAGVVSAGGDAAQPPASP
eukprot:3755498-Prymnesium_polylepis.1